MDSKPKEAPREPDVSTINIVDNLDVNNSFTNRCATQSLEHTNVVDTSEKQDEQLDRPDPHDIAIEGGGGKNGDNTRAEKGCKEQREVDHSGHEPGANSCNCVAVIAGCVACLPVCRHSCVHSHLVERVDLVEDLARVDLEFQVSAAPNTDRAP